MKEIKRGDIFYADLGFDKFGGSEQQGERPVVIIQNDIGNTYSPTVIVAVMTTKDKKKLPVHIEAENNYYLKKHSIVMLEQIRTIDKRKLKDRVGRLGYWDIKNLNKALKLSVGL